MDKTKILFIGGRADIMQTILQLINTQTNFMATGATSDQEAALKFKADHFKLFLIGGGVEEQSEHELRHLFISRSPNIKIIKHYGGGSGLLFNEINEALK